MRATLVCWAAALASLGCGGPGRPAGPWIDERSDGATVVVRLGEVLTVSLRSAGDGGYGDWTLSGPPDAAVLRLLAAAHQPGSGVPGDAGRDVFVLEAVGPGTTSLAASAVRPFSGERLAFAVAVEVRPP